MLTTTGDAVRALRLLSGRVGADGRSGDDAVGAVSTVTSPLLATVTGKRSMPRGAGPAFFSPAWLYCDPWHGHSNHWLVAHDGTRQPRCGHFW